MLNPFSEIDSRSNYGLIFFLKIEDDGTACLLILFLEADRATVSWLLRLLQVAGWLWKLPQAEQEPT
jgi:hypothetical protein